MVLGWFYGPGKLASGPKFLRGHRFRTFESVDLDVLTVPRCPHCSNMSAVRIGHCTRWQRVSASVTAPSCFSQVRPLYNGEGSPDPVNVRPRLGTKSLLLVTPGLGPDLMQLGQRSLAELSGRQQLEEPCVWNATAAQPGQVFLQFETLFSWTSDTGTVCAPPQFAAVLLGHWLGCLSNLRRQHCCRMQKHCRTADMLFWCSLHSRSINVAATKYPLVPH